MLTFTADCKRRASIDHGWPTIDSVKSEAHPNLGIRRRQANLHRTLIPTIGASSGGRDLGGGCVAVDSDSEWLLRFSIAGQVHAPVIDNVNAARRNVERPGVGLGRSTVERVIGVGSAWSVVRCVDGNPRRTLVPNIERRGTWSRSLAWRRYWINPDLHWTLRLRIAGAIHTPVDEAVESAIGDTERRGIGLRRSTIDLIERVLNSWRSVSRGKCDLRLIGIPATVALRPRQCCLRYRNGRIDFDRDRCRKDGVTCHVVTPETHGVGAVTGDGNRWPWISCRDAVINLVESASYARQVVGRRQRNLDITRVVVVVA